MESIGFNITTFTAPKDGEFQFQIQKINSVDSYNAYLYVNDIIVAEFIGGNLPYSSALIQIPMRERDVLTIVYDNIEKTPSYSAFKPFL